MKSILIVDDHRFIAESAEALIAKSSPDSEIVICHTADETLEALTSGARDWRLILLDLDIPGAVGLSLAARIRDMGLAPVTCIWTGNERSDFVAQARADGFLGYVLKADTSTKELEAALTACLSGKRVFSGVQGPAAMLTQRQIEVLQFVAEGKTSKEIGKHLALHPGTVNSHIEAGMLALSAKSRVHAVQRAMALGLLRFDAPSLRVEKEAGDIA